MDLGRAPTRMPPSTSALELTLQSAGSDVGCFAMERGSVQSGVNLGRNSYADRLIETVAAPVLYA
jgi:hypothetical protein